MTSENCSRATVLMAFPEELEKRMKATPAGWPVLAARAALRVLPLTGRVLHAPPRGKQQFLLHAFRINHFVWAAAYYPTTLLQRADTNELGVRAAASAEHFAHAVDDRPFMAEQSNEANYSHYVHAALSGVRAARASVAEAPINDAMASILDAVLAAEFVSPEVAAETQDVTLRDAAWLASSGTPEQLIRQRLWLGMPDAGTGCPLWLQGIWDDFAQSKDAGANAFTPWITWYDSILPAGRLTQPRDYFGKSIATFLLEQSESWWQREVPLVNAEVAKKLGFQGPVPPQDSSSLRPAWVDGRMMQPIGPAQSNFAPIADLMKGTKAALVELAEDIPNQPNVDRRIVNFVQRLAAQMPDEVPPLSVVFVLAPKARVLIDYIESAFAEWDRPFATQFAEVARQLERALASFPELAESRRAAQGEIVLREDIAVVEQVGNAVADFLEGLPDYSTPGLSEALREGIENLVSLDPMPHNNLLAPPAQADAALDLLRGINNVLKRMAAAALGVAESIGKFTGEVATRFKAEFRAEVLRLIDRLARVAARAVFVGPLLAWLNTYYPTLFGWLRTLPL